MNSIQRSVCFGLLLAASLMLAVRPASGHDGHNHASSVPSKTTAAASNASPQNPALQPPPAQPTRSGPPHGGQFKIGAQHIVEVVYLPQQVQVYLYDTQGQPLSAQNVVGDVAMEVNGNPRQWWWRLESVPGGSYLVANVDLSRVRDRDMVALFELKNLPSREEPQVRFAQLFFLSQAVARVEVVPLVAGDREAVARQGVCPVMAGGFDHGPPIKLLVDRQPLFVCCESCVEEIKKDPDRFASTSRLESLRLVRQTTSGPSVGKGSPLPQNLVALYGARPGVTATEATAVDARFIAQQRICPVTKQPLGSMGTPVRVTIDGRSIYVCCRACVAEIEKDPLFYVPPPAEAPAASCSSGRCSSGGCTSCRK